ncbi:MAG TPA: tetratricopeptide repeat protein [Thermoanaerobaculia bacterium]|nr:tetratricopeptide repeat protein [Thermoanaerobaculia bacterium]
MNGHPTVGELEKFLRGSAAPEVNRQVVRHLLAKCSPCRASLEGIGWGPERRERVVSLLAGDPDELPDGMAVVESYDYEESFANAWEVCRRELDSPTREVSPERETVEEDLQLDELLAGAEDRVPERRFVELLLARSHAVRYHDAAAMLRWARVARLLAERCDAETVGGAAALADLRARAWGQFGNALRVTGRLRKSATALERASGYAAAGTGDRSLRAELASWTASLLIFERQFDRAIALIDEAAGIARSLGRRRDLAWCLSNKAIATVYSGRADEAIRILDEAMRLVDRSDPRLLLTVFHNLIYCYVEAGHLQEALALFPQTRSVGEEIQDELVMLRLLWQEARILCELGLLEEAEAQFARAREGFIEHDLAYEAAVVSLDLTAVYVKLGLTVEVRRTVADILPVFSSLRVGRELLASLIQLQQAEDQTQALHLIRALSRELVAGPKLPPSV